mgnify:CR=1 FL=1
MMTFPQTIKIKSDGNVLELKEIEKPPKGEQLGVYIYAKSKTKKDQILKLTLEQVGKML